MKQIKLVDLVLSKKAGKEIYYPVPNKEEISIGRNFDSDVVIPPDYSDVSRKHCIIYQREGKVTIEDNSSHGTYVNGKKVLKAELKEGDRLKLGSLELGVKIRNELDFEEPLDLKKTPADSSTEFEINA